VAPGGSDGHGDTAGGSSRGGCGGLAALLPRPRRGGDAPTCPQPRPALGRGANRERRSRASASETPAPSPLARRGGKAACPRAARSPETSWTGMVMPAEGTVIALGCREKLVELNKGKI